MACLRSLQPSLSLWLARVVVVRFMSKLDLIYHFVLLGVLSHDESVHSCVGAWMTIIKVKLP